VSDVKRIVILAQLMRQQQDRVQELEDQLKDAKELLRMTEREDLPMLMAELGISELKLEDGSVVKVVEEVDCRISDATRERALKWLVDNGFGGLIKTQVVAVFGRGERDQALKAFEKLVDEPADVSLKEEVHPSTLKAFVKEQIAAGTALPLDAFNVFSYNKATLKAAKKA
jgi:hypothetical protein